MALPSVLLFAVGVSLTLWSTCLAAHPFVISEVIRNAPMPCEYPGFFRHSVDCQYFYRCVNITLERYQRYIFSCPPTTVFDSLTSVCVPPFMTDYCDTADPSASFSFYGQYYDKFSDRDNSQIILKRPVTVEENPDSVQIRDSTPNDHLTIQDLDEYHDDEHDSPFYEEIDLNPPRQTYREETEPSAVELLPSLTDDYEEITTSLPQKTYQQQLEITTQKVIKKPAKTYKDVTTTKPVKTIKPNKIYRSPIIRRTTTQEPTTEELTTTEEPTTQEPTTEELTTTEEPTTQVPTTQKKPVKTYKKPSSTKKPVKLYREPTTELVIEEEEVTTVQSVKKYGNPTILTPSTQKPIKTYQKSTTPKSVSRYRDSTTSTTTEEPVTKRPIKKYLKTSKKPLITTRKPSQRYGENENDRIVQSFDEEFDNEHVHLQTNTDVISNTEESTFHPDDSLDNEFQIYGGPIGINTPDLDKQEQSASELADEKIIKGHMNEHEYLDESEEVKGHDNFEHGHAFVPSNHDYEYDKFIEYEEMPPENEANSFPNYQNKVTSPLKKTYHSTPPPSQKIKPTTERYSNKYGNTNKQIKVTTTSVNKTYKNKPKPQVSYDSNKNIKAPVEVIINSDYNEDQEITSSPRVRPGHNKQTMETPNWNLYTYNQQLPDQYNYMYSEYPQFPHTELASEKYNNQKNRFKKPIHHDINIVEPTHEESLHSQSEPQENSEDNVYEDILKQFDPVQQFPHETYRKTDIQLDDSAFYDDFSDIEAITVRPKFSWPTRPTRITRPSQQRSTTPNIAQHESDYEDLDEILSPIELEPVDESTYALTENSQPNASYKKKIPSTSTPKPRYERSTTTTPKPRYQQRSTITTAKPRYQQRTTTTTPKPRYQHRTLPPSTPKPKYEHKATRKIFRKTKSPTYKEETTEQPEAVTEESYHYYDIEVTPTVDKKNENSEMHAVTKVTGELAEDYSDEDVVQPDTTTTLNVIQDIPTTSLPKSITTESDYEYEDLGSSKNSLNISQPPTTEAYMTTNATSVNEIVSTESTSTTSAPDTNSTNSTEATTKDVTTPNPTTKTPEELPVTSTSVMISTPKGSLSDRGSAANANRGNLNAPAETTVNQGATNTGGTSSEVAPNRINPSPNTLSRNPLEPPPLEARNVAGSSLKRKQKRE